MQPMISPHKFAASTATTDRQLCLPSHSAAGVLDEKASAVAALGAYAGDMGAAFGPYIEATLKILLDLAGNSLLVVSQPIAVLCNSTVQWMFCATALCNPKAACCSS